jgi:hypothetical protein
MNGWQTDLPNVRDHLAPEFAELSDEQIDALVEHVYGEGIGAEDLEGFFDNLKRGFGNIGGAVGKFAQQAAPALQNALPGMAQGAMAGSALGPWGMLAGAITGGAGSVLSQSKDPTLRGIGRGLGTATQLASSIRGGGGAAGGVGKLLQGGLSQLGGGRGRRGGGAAGGDIGNLLQGGLSQLAGGRGRRGGGAAGGDIGNLLQGGLSQLAGGARSWRGGAAPAGDIGNLIQSGLSQLAGGGLGNVANLLQGGQPQPGGGAPAPGTPAPPPGIPAPPPGASANALLGLLGRPEVRQALGAAAMGGLGRQDVQIGSTQVSVQSILSALGNLAGRAADDMPGGDDDEPLPEYFYDANGELAIDPAESHSRADRLLYLMAATSPIWAVQRPPVVVVQQREPEYTEADAEADELLWAEIYESEYQEAEAHA